MSEAATAEDRGLSDDELRSWAEYCWNMYHESAKPELLIAWQRNGDLARILGLQPACEAEIRAMMQSMIDQGKDRKAKFEKELGESVVAHMTEEDLRHVAKVGDDAGIAWMKAKYAGIAS